MVKRFTHRYPLFVLMLIQLMVMSVHAADIKVSTDRNPVNMNESFQLIYETGDSVDGDPDFSPLEEYLDIIDQSQSSKVSIINGHYTSSRNWRLTVMAKQVGKLTLPGIKFGRDKTPSYNITVNAAAKDAVAESGFFARLEAEIEQVYVQQQLVVTLQLFSDRNLWAYSMGDLKVEGMDALIEPLEDEKHYKTRFSNREYLVVEQKYVVFPQDSGTLEILPVEVEARTGSAVNSVLGSMANRGSLMRGRSNVLSLNVLPVPATADMKPWLPASDMELVEQWPDDPPRFTEGEPVTRTLSLKAEGLTSAQLPELPEREIDGLKQYPDQAMLNDVRNVSGVTGYRLQKIAFVPTRAGAIELPAIEIPWWDTDTDTRKIVRIPARTIQVTAVQKPAAQNVPRVEQPVNPPVTESSSFEPVPEAQPAPVAAPNDSSKWKLAAIILAVGWLVTLLLWFLFPRRKSITKESGTDSSLKSIRQAYKGLAKACRAQDEKACRYELLQWAQVLFKDRPVSILNDVIVLVPSDMAAEIRKIDAVLYGDQQQEIDFAIISRRAGELTRTARKESPSNAGVLEPLYR